ncbi:DUF3343 domain-containing protein [Sporosalibacterium faouarense]|uniref:DUF3343 domain-containing protein n=1 Tax=Sporosalibacterium faouarense TaxID=516123 RepID=UPI00141CC724|nr:DUF3343 domain-containing protein [Sporosalibacterium faouarense]MTI46213.1 DUF3343 domain-containing protein [Bacillota bacterium]
MKEEQYCVITFNSTHHAIKGEKVLNEKGLDIRTIPTPREITASCGLSIRFATEDLEKVRKIIGDIALDIKGIYEVKKMLSDKIVTEV